MQELSDLNNSEARELLTKIQQIMRLSHEQAKTGVYASHEVYCLARDCKDLLMFDATSREMIAKLSQSDQTVVMGHVVSDAVKQFVKEGRTINAIKQLREESGLGLKEAKDVVEEYARTRNSW